MKRELAQAKEAIARSKILSLWDLKHTQTKKCEAPCQKGKILSLWDLKPILMPPYFLLALSKILSLWDLKLIAPFKRLTQQK